MEIRCPILAAALLLACTREPPPQPALGTGAARPGSAAPVAVPAARISAGCLGGVTGGGTGATLHRSGALFRWTQPGPGSDRRDSTLVRTDSSLAASLAARLTGANFAELALREPANMTCFLSWEADSSVHEAIWPIGQDSLLPVDVRAVYHDLRRAAGETER